MKIYLICPPQEESFWGFEKAIAWQGYKANFMPLGMITVAAVAENMGHKVKVTDARFQKIDYDSDADVIGISFYNVQKEDAFKIAEEFRKRGKYVVLGGSYPRSSREECNKYADTLICGEGETAFKDFLIDFEKGKPKKIYDSGKLDMKQSPVPAYHLIDIKKYRYAGINYTRGCPFNCEFCDIKEEWFNGRSVRIKDNKQIIRELEVLKKFKVKNIFFHDDNFVGIPAKTKELLREIILWQKKNKFRFSYMAEASLNIAFDDELLDLFKEANFSTLFVGVESPNVESLKGTNKVQNTAGDIIRNIIKIQRKGIPLSAGMITGFDEDKKNIFESMYHFIQRTGILITSLGPLVVLPGTPLERRMKKEGRLLCNEMYHPAFLHKKNVDMTINYAPKHMSGEDLIKGTNWVLGKIYSHKGFTERFWQYIRNLGNNYKNVIEHGDSDVADVSFSKKIKFIKRIFLSSPKQFYYNTKLMIKLMIFKPEFVPNSLAYLAAHNHIYLYYKKFIEDPDKVPDKCPVKLTSRDKAAIKASSCLQYLEKIKASSLDKNINMLQDALDNISSCINSLNKKSLIELRDRCVKRLNKIKEQGAERAVKERTMLKKDLDKFLSLVKSKI